MMATKSSLFTCLLIIISHYFYHATCTSAPPPSQELHLYYIRHVHSRGNAWKIDSIFHRDAWVADKGAEQLRDILDSLGNTMYDEIKKHLHNDHKISFEASTLRRTVWTALSVRKSLIKKFKMTPILQELKGKKSQKPSKLLQQEKKSTEGTLNGMRQKSKMAPVLQELKAKTSQKMIQKLENAKFSIVMDLQEEPGKNKPSSTSKFEEMTGMKASGPIGTGKHCDGFKKYLFDAVQWTPEKQQKRLKAEHELKHDICPKTDYVKATRWTSNEKVSGWWPEEQLIHRIEDYGKRLRDKIDAGQKVLVVAGHGSWIRFFVDTFAETEELKKGWGKKGKHLGNGEMVHVVITADNNDNNKVKIKSITSKFRAKPETH